MTHATRREGGTTRPTALARAAAAHRAGRLGEALAIYRRILAAEPENAEALALAGLLQLQAGNIQAARGLLTRALAIRPDHAMARLNLGNVHRAEGRLDEAATQFEMAAALDARMAGACNNLGLVRHAQGRLDDAARAFEAALGIAPGFADALNSLGLVRRDQGDLEAAVAAFRRAVDHAPGLIDARVNLAGALRETGEAQAAVAAYREALALAPGRIEITVALAGALGEAGDAKAAVATLRDAVRAHPDEPRLLVELGNALQSAGRGDDAVDTYRQALAHDPDNPDIHYDLALAHLGRGRHDEARAAFHQVLRRERGGPWWNAHDFESALAQTPPPPPGPLRTSTFRLRDTIDQIEHLIDLGLLDPSFAAMSARYRAVLGEIVAREGAEAAVALNDHQRARIGAFHGRALRYADTPPLAGSAVNEALDFGAIEESYLASSISITTFDDFLSPEALAALREFCQRSTIFFAHSGARFVGSTLRTGFNCRLLYRIAEALKARLPRVLGGHALTNCWVYRHANETVGVEAHTDQGAVTFNFWITPDEANLDPEHGGLEVYAKEQPHDWDWTTYNRFKYTPSILGRINDFLASTETVTIPYRCNRAVLFHSNLFHKSDHVRFRSGYLNRRMNVTMLFGKRDAGG